jgi:DNA-binding NtrC family response regulator
MLHASAQTLSTNDKTPTFVNILFVHYDPEIQTEINEFLKLRDAKIYFSINTEETIHILNDKAIEMVVLKINNMKDAAILKYINDSYKELEVLVMASKEYDEIISVFNKGRFELFSQPLKLSELKKNIDHLMMNKMKTAKTRHTHKHA